MSQDGARKLLIAIDGPAGSGKSTVARLLAGRLGYLYLDTGALYRAVAWKVRQARVDPQDSVALEALLASTSIRMGFEEGLMRVFVDDQEVTAELRTPEMTSLASIVSAVPVVRAWLLPIQRKIGLAGAVVAEGRDMGTTVFPQADVKFFLEADPDVRAARRHRELVAAGHSMPFTETSEALSGRDTRDRTRTVAPLAQAEDAIAIDTSPLQAEEVVERMLAVIAAKL